MTRTPPEVRASLLRAIGGEPDRAVVALLDEYEAAVRADPKLVDAIEALDRATPTDRHGYVCVTDDVIAELRRRGWESRVQIHTYATRSKPGREYDRLSSGGLKPGWWGLDVDGPYRESNQMAPSCPSCGKDRGDQ